MIEGAPTIHVGDVAQPVRQVIVVHADPVVVAGAEPAAAWIPRKAAAARLSISVAQVSVLIDQGKLAARKIGALVQVEVASIDAYEASLVAPAKRDPAPAADVTRNVRQLLRAVK